jgi:hypothetical protein
MTWAEFKKAGAGVTAGDAITGFRWFNDRYGNYYVTVWFDGRREGITLKATRAEAR